MTEAQGIEVIAQLDKIHWLLVALVLCNSWILGGVIWRAICYAKGSSSLWAVLLVGLLASPALAQGAGKTLRNDSVGAEPFIRLQGGTLASSTAGEWRSADDWVFGRVDSRLVFVPGVHPPISGGSVTLRYTVSVNENVGGDRVWLFGFFYDGRFFVPSGVDFLDTGTVTRSYDLGVFREYIEFNTSTWSPVRGSSTFESLYGPISDLSAGIVRFGFIGVAISSASFGISMYEVSWEGGSDPAEGPDDGGGDGPGGGGGGDGDTRGEKGQGTNDPDPSKPGDPPEPASTTQPSDTCWDSVRTMLEAKFGVAMPSVTGEADRKYEIAIPIGSIDEQPEATSFYISTTINESFAPGEALKKLLDWSRLFFIVLILFVLFRSIMKDLARW